MDAASIFLVDDHPIVREGLFRLIDREPDLGVCGEAEDAAGALDGLARTSPDVVVVDLSLKGSYLYPQIRRGERRARRRRYR
ncbi:response regulator [Rhodocaloribacter litoris]|uniref:response regulator transcription factor n=1 Tax=Rhodocaloribacter litoris TaxID=2558931 RepID=UPI0014202E7A|nr:response regulator [Rhodocaloribacter litoris]QXD15189.1 response regulator [Rhodocaloribacter litoris]